MWAGGLNREATFWILILGPESSLAGTSGLPQGLKWGSGCFNKAHRPLNLAALTLAAISTRFVANAFPLCMNDVGDLYLRW